MKTTAAKKPLAISQVLDMYLRAFAEFHFLTAVQLTRRFYKPGMLTTVQTRLKSLVDAGYLHSFMLPTIKSKSPFVYALSAKGAKYLRDVDEVVADVVYKPSELEELSHSFLHHVGELNDFLLAAKSLEQVAPGWRVAQIWHDLTLHKNPLVVPGNFFGTKSKPRSVYPDGFLDIRQSIENQRQRQYCLWVEMDRGTEAVEPFKDKIVRIAGAIQSGVVQDYFGIKQVSAVAFATTAGNNRVKQIQKWTLEVLGEKHTPPGVVDLFVFAIFSSTLPPRDVFLEPIWITPHNEGIELLGDGS
jgi:hypothetical protein